MTSQENQIKLWFPMNPITEKLYYTHEDTISNQRMIISAPIPRPITWQVSKVETTKPVGINCLTFTQDVFNPKTDYVNLETGEMYADYYSLTPEPEPEKPQELIRNISCEIKCNAATIKCGGSYKKLTALFRDANGNDITAEYAGLVKRESWPCSIDGTDTTTSDLVAWLTQPESNVMKLKFTNDRTYLSKVLKVRCDVLTEIGEVTGETNLEIVAI